MQLSTEDQNRIKAWLEKKCGPAIFRCTCCGLGNWELAPFASIQLAVDLHTTRFYYHQGIPVVSLTCSNCGNLLLFSSAVMGFRADQPPVVSVQEPKPATPEVTGTSE